MAAPMERCIRSHFLNRSKSFSVALCSTRLCETLAKHVKKRKKEVTIPTLPPDDIDNDWIGPPDKLSNIRQIRICVPPNETAIEREYREKREALQKWHHQFWAKHNKSFFQKKEEFINQRLEGRSGTGAKDEESITPEELSIFYKQFLDDNYKSHAEYNKEWYKRNIALLWPAIKVQIVRLWLGGQRKKDNFSKTDT